MSVRAYERPVASRLTWRKSASLDPLKTYFSVLYALVLHDIKARFFGTGLGQIVMILWPFIHMIVLIAIYYFVGRQVPFGDSLVLYSAVSITPFIIFSYMSRWIVYSAMTNKSFLQYPIIKPLDLLIGRAVLEVVSSLIVTILLIITVVSLGIDPWPIDCAKAVYALGASFFLAFAIGVFNGAIALVVPLWSTLFTLCILITYASSGILFVPSMLPERIREIAGYNPVLQCIEWMRTAYYADYPTLVLDRFYVLQFSLITLSLGFIIERLVRRLV